LHKIRCIEEKHPPLLNFPRGISQNLKFIPCCPGKLINFIKRKQSG
jgi:hypothetical protein